MGRRITRKQLKQDDEFVSAGEIVLRWLTQNWRPIAAGVAAVGVVAVLWWGASLWTGQRTDKASRLLYEAVATFEGESAVPGGVPTGDVEAAEQKFLEVIDRFGRSDQADMARLYLARIDVARGERDAARSALVELSERHPDDAIGRLATVNLINLRIESGQASEVAAELQEIVDGRSSRLPVDTALYTLGELLDREGQPDEARESYQKLVDEFPESPYVMEARQRLSELG